LADKWILHKLNKAAVEANKGLSERNFLAATNAIYQFWLYELCDVYIEVIKPVCDLDTTNDESADRRKTVAQNTLYTCLEGGLKLLHPFSPFVTEELYQRLGRRPGDVIPSIVKAKYPINEPTFVNEAAAKQFDIVFEATKSIRSLAVQLNKKKEGVAFVHAGNNELHELLTAESPSILALARGIKNLTVSVKGDAPAGTEAAEVNADITVYLEK
jgi:valyl-tRNA synthetase